MQKNRTHGTGSVREVNGRLYAQISVGGNGKVERAIGPATMGKREQEARIRAKTAELEAKRPIDDHSVTIADAAAAHLADRKRAGKKQNTLDNYERDARVHYIPFFAGKPIKRITEQDLDRYIDAKLAAGLTPKTVCNHLKHLNAIYRLAIRKRWATFNPVELIERPADARESKEIRFLTVEQLQKLLRVAAENIDRQRHTIRSLERGAKIRELREKGLEWATIGLAMDCCAATAIYLSRATGENVEHDPLAATDRVIWLVAAQTGLRQGELLSLRWRDIDWVAPAIRAHRNTSPEGTPKSDGSFRVVPMAIEAARELEHHFQASAFQADDQLVFGHPSTGERLDRTGVTIRFQRSLERARLPRITFHELRHTFGTINAANPKVSIRTLQAWLGHADIKTTQIYTHYSPRAHEAALIDESFAGLDLNSAIPSADFRQTQTISNQENPANTREAE